MVDENTGELVADGFVDQHRGDRGIDAARQAADHLAVADLGPDLGDLCLAEIRHRPVTGAACDLMHEVGEQLAAVRRVHHFRVELHAVERLALMAITAKGDLSEDCDGPKPSESSTILSPWLIQT